jgi:hypothetical protein
MRSRMSISARRKAGVLAPLDQDVEARDDRQARADEGHELLVEEQELLLAHARAERDQRRDRADRRRRPS